MRFIIYSDIVQININNDEMEEFLGMVRSCSRSKFAQRFADELNATFVMKGQNRIGWRRSKKGKKFHYFDHTGKPVCGKKMTNIYLAGENISDEQYCERCMRGFNKPSF